MCSLYLYAANGTNKSLWLEFEMNAPTSRTALNIRILQVVDSRWGTSWCGISGADISVTQTGHNNVIPMYVYTPLASAAQREWMCWYFQSQLICMNAATVHRRILTDIHQSNTLGRYPSNLTVCDVCCGGVDGIVFRDIGRSTCPVNRLHLELATKRMCAIIFCDAVE